VQAPAQDERHREATGWCAWGPSTRALRAEWRLLLTNAARLRLVELLAELASSRGDLTAATRLLSAAAASARQGLGTALPKRSRQRVQALLDRLASEPWPEPADLYQVLDEAVGS
jgi:hypothetical protein